MENEQQTSLGEFPTQSPTISTIRTGVAQSLDWSRASPRLYFVDDNDPLALSGLVGRRTRITVEDERFCTNCGKPAEWSPCSDCQGTPPMAECVYNPGVSCTYQNCPYPEFKQESCAHDFVVYLVVKDRVKVGITRAGRRTKRWKGQGATHALVLARAPNRKLAGVIETCCASHLDDSATSDWFSPLPEPEADLLDAAAACRDALPSRLRTCLCAPEETDAEREARIIELDYPERNPNNTDFTKVDSFSEPGEREGRLCAVRGSVLATDTFTFNVRTHAGRHITIATERWT